jgi:diguanylate cyclase (GGDEF)-like protein
VAEGLARSSAGRIGDAHALRLRLRRFHMSQMSYAMWFAVTLAAWVFGMFDGPGWALVAAAVGIAITQTTFYLLIRSGASLRFADPSLTFAQIGAAVAWALMLLAFTSELRGLLAAVLMIAILFGVFALERRQFLQLAFGAGLGYLTIIGVERWLRPGLHPDSYYVISALILAGALAWTALFGAYVSDMRRKLSSRNDDLQKALAKISELAERDDLTGLHNRRFIMEVLARLIARAERDGERFSICIIDLDHFKRINDRFGHAAGDQVLIAFARLVESELRSMDYVAHNVAHGVSFGRYGGEEFILLLPATPLEGAAVCAERLRARQAAARHPAAPIVTLSAGIAEYRPGEGSESLLRRADRALYEAKYAGRNRVHHAAA